MRKKGEVRKLSSNAIKLIAILAMTIDHVAWLIFPSLSREPVAIVMHIIGRITCPIMCYFVAEGYHHTKNINKYTARLFVFAFISHFAYVFALKGMDSLIPFKTGILDQTSVMWSLAWGLVLLRIGEREKNRGVLIFVVCALCFCADWSCIAALMILAFGTNRGDFREQMRWLLIYCGMYALVYVLTIDALYGAVQLAVVLAIPVLKMYNGERGKNKAINTFMKWLFYLYYPLHLFVIGLLKLGGI